MAELTGSKRHDTGPQIARVEGNVDPRERDSCKPAVQLDEALCLLLLLCLFKARLNDFAQHLLDLVERELGGELWGL
jgi:hypothetical protein